MKPITYQARNVPHFAFVDVDGQTVCCGKCHSELGRVSRLVLEEVSEQMRLPYPDSKYDPVRAQGRARILEKAGATVAPGKTYFTFKAGYMQLKDGLYALSSQPDDRTHEGRVLRSREKGLLKQAEKLWPEGKTLFVGEVRYRFYEFDSGEEPRYTENRFSENFIVFDIFGNADQINEILQQINMKWSRERQDDLHNKWRAESLRDSAQYIAEQRKENLFLEMPPIEVDQEPMPAKCWKCEEDNAIVLRQIAADFELWEAKVLAGASAL